MNCNIWSHMFLDLTHESDLRWIRNTNPSLFYIFVFIVFSCVVWRGTFMHMPQWTCGSQRTTWQHTRAGSLLPPHVFQRLNSSDRAEPQALLPSESPHEPSTFCTQQVGENGGTWVRPTLQMTWEQTCRMAGEAHHTVRYKLAIKVKDGMLYSGVKI